MKINTGEQQKVQVQDVVQLIKGLAASNRGAEGVPGANITVYSELTSANKAKDKLICNRIIYGLIFMLQLTY